MRILGVSAFYHDSAAALVDGGRIVAAAQEERFTRRKHDAGYPRLAVAACLRQAGLEARDVDRVVFYDKPFLKWERLLETYVAVAPRGFRPFAMALPLWVREKLFQKRLLRREMEALDPAVDWRERLLFAEHHQSHAASAFYPSPFREAAVLTMDGVGEWATTSAGVGRGAELTIGREIHFPHSLGLLYSAFAYYTGFRVNSGEHKMMGLAPYGEPTYLPAILEHLVDLKDDGSFRLDLDYFGYCDRLRMTNPRFEALFGGPPRQPEEPIERRHADLAASVQAAVEEAVLRLTRSLREESGIPYLCLAGGVALNCVANGKVLRDGRFDDVWIQPAAGDAGGAIGAALAAAHGLFGEPRALPSEASSPSAAAPRDSMRGASLGPGYAPDEVRAALDAAGARYETLPGDALIGAAADALAEGKAVGWFQGRMEFGPRALGSRSILADPRSPSMRETLNRKVKLREAFRPFAPSVPRERAAEWFGLDRESPYMLLTAEVRPERRRHGGGAADDAEASAAADAGGLGWADPGGGEAARSEIPAVTHVDGSARVQTVDRAAHPRFHALLEAFGERTGCPVLVNTSFNVRGEPIVCTPDDAFRCFLGTDIDCLAIGDCFLRKEEQDPALVARARAHADAFEPD